MQNCPFYDALQNNPLKLGHYGCDVTKILLNDCNATLVVDNIERYEKKVLLLRAGIDPKKVDPTLEICAAHREILGRKFTWHLWENKCRFKKHLDSRTLKLTTHDKHVTYYEAHAAHQCVDLQLPLGMPICNQCRETVSEELGIVPMDSETSSDRSILESSSGNSEGYKLPPPKSPQSQSAGEDSNSLDLTTLSEGIDKIPQTRSVTRANPRSVIDQSVLDQLIGDDPSETVPYMPTKPARSALKNSKEPYRKPHKLKLASLNNYMETCEVETFPGHQHFKNLRYEDCKDPGRKRKILAALARAVKALLGTASESEEDSIVMWKDLMDSKLVEKELCVEAQMSVELSAHVQLWNDAADYADRIRISAILNSCYKFSAVNRFNQKAEASIAGEEATEIDISKLEPNGLYFKPPITPHIWKQGGLHAKNGALSEVIREKIVRWKYDLAVVQSIQAFVNHPDVTQRVAYGTRWVKNPKGGRTEVANVIREIPNALLSRQIHTHLKAQQFPGKIPTKRTICVMLENMPASKTRSLEVRIREYY